MRLRLPLFVLLLPFLAVPRAAADTVTITDGFLLAAAWSDLSPPSLATGTDGFTLSTALAIGPGGGNLGPMTWCDGTCIPGTRLNVGGYLDSADGGGMTQTRVTIAGTEYEVAGLDPYVLILRPDGFFTVPAFGTSSIVTVLAPFTLTGSFFDNLLFTETRIAGQGTAAITLKRPANLELPGWERVSVRYDFETPSTVPEPTSMLLLGSGLAAVMAARRRRMRG